GGPGLLSVDLPAAIGKPLGPGAHRSEVGAGVRLAHADTAISFTSCHAGEVLAALRLGAQLAQRRPGLAVGDPVRAHRSADREQFLQQHVALDTAALLASVAFGPSQAYPPLGAELAREFAVVHGPGVGFLLGGPVGQLAPQELADLAAELRDASR